MAQRPCHVCGAMRPVGNGSRDLVTCRDCRRSLSAAEKYARGIIKRKPRESNPRPQPTQRRCEWCSKGFHRHLGGKDVGAYCSRECAARSRRTHVWHWRTVLVVTNCTRCGLELRSRNGRRRCANTCTPPCVDCGGRAVRGNRCPACRRARTKARRAELRRNERAQGKRASDKHRSRARRYGVAYQYVKPVDIYARDGWCCQLCNEPIDRDLPPNDDWAPSLDHIVAMASGGAHVPSNLQAAHRWCNSAKGTSRTLF